MPFKLSKTPTSSNRVAATVFSIMSSLQACAGGGFYEQDDYQAYSDVAVDEKCRGYKGASSSRLKAMCAALDQLETEYDVMRNNPEAVKSLITRTREDLGDQTAECHMGLTSARELRRSYGVAGNFASNTAPIKIDGEYREFSVVCAEPDQD